MNKIKQMGFTLVELVTVVIIVAVLAAYAVPTFTDYLERKKVDAAITQIISGVALARSEAITKGRQVAICGGIDHFYCAGWSEKGWKIMVTGTDPQIIQVYQPKGVIVEGFYKGAAIDGDGSMFAPEFSVLPKSGNKANGKTVIFTQTAAFDKITEWTDVL